MATADVTSSDDVISDVTSDVVIRSDVILCRRRPGVMPVLVLCVCIKLHASSPRDGDSASLNVTNNSLVGQLQRASEWSPLFVYWGLRARRRGRRGQFAPITSCEREVIQGH